MVPLTRSRALVPVVAGIACALAASVVGGPASAAVAPPPDGPSAAAVQATVVTGEPVRVVADWPVPAGRVRCATVTGAGGVAADATGVLVNVTTVRPGGPGHVVVYPDSTGTGATPAPAGSTVNFEPGRTSPTAPSSPSPRAAGSAT
ncbi:hypothetical protein [Actinotalea fermentans]|uniref:PASTA domain-containing protein n=1 Tax=Actinotalea fermentans TaxID=43671 RepID=A0A511Z194_9CELL|nr:hypothetical protein [Actinotalea fermentans]KGM17430.1 hypothetical protein N867_03560 [Actinotalea fermentans ATCC 43279 = JCM 9966 = DSM 3133]GEN81230.1 hypothetical protein AFE02nite_29640 [Actinotalea fermentans]